MGTFSAEEALESQRAYYKVLYILFMFNSD
jgi:hypothetical protein